MYLCFTAVFNNVFFLFSQGNSTKDYFLSRTMQSLERYFYLIVFNAYLHEQVKLLLWSIIPLVDVMSASDCDPVVLFCSIRLPLCPTSASGCAATRGCTGCWPAWICPSCWPLQNLSPAEPAFWWGNLYLYLRLIFLIFT